MTLYQACIDRDSLIALIARKQGVLQGPRHSTARTAESRVSDRSVCRARYSGARKAKSEGNFTVDDDRNTVQAVISSHKTAPIGSMEERIDC